jgi:uncharacterized protein (TIGR00299 family) protein
MNHSDIDATDLHLWIDPGFGASGDMLLGALAGYLDARGDEARGDEAGDETRAMAALRRLEHLRTLNPGGVDGWSLRQESVVRCGLAAVRMHVDTDATSSPRHWSQIDNLLVEADLPEYVRSGARATFRLLGEIEAEQHRVDIEHVHFHEVGAVDSIVDIVGVWILLAEIAPTTVTVGPVGLGHGSVGAEHGMLPLPAPATVGLLTGVPTRGLDIEAETCTPTGAALLVSIADRWGPLPDGVITTAARGAGGRDPDTHPNVVTVIGLATTSGTGAAQVEAALIIQCNVDDATPEQLAHTVQRLLDAGAADAWIVPIVMKKGRAASEVRVLTDHGRHDHLVALLLADTGSLGCRTVHATKHVLPRTVHHVEVRGHTIRIKVGPHSAKPEFDDLVAASNATAIPVRRLDLEARLAWEQT